MDGINVSKRLALGLSLLVILTLTTIPSLTVSARSSTIIVPDNYPTLTAAIGNATNGDTILVRSGTYDGPINTTLTITKSITIIGENPQNTIIRLYPAVSVNQIMYWPLYTYTDAITITADSCTLQNLNIQMVNKGSITAQSNRALFTGNHITALYELILKGANSRITNNVLDGNIRVNGSYNQIDKNTVGFIQVSGTHNFIKNNDCLSLNLAYSENNVFLENSAIREPWGDWGVSLDRSNSNYFYKNTFSGNIFGLTLRYASNNVFQANTITNCLRASISVTTSENNVFSLNNFADNPDGFADFVFDNYNDLPTREADPELTLSANIWSNSGLGNYWGDYQTKYPNATAIDNTNVGNIPYNINEQNTDDYPLIARYDISTAAIQLPDWVTNLDVPSVSAPPTFPPYVASPSPPSPSPTVPEMSWLAIIPLLLCLFAVTVVFRKRIQRIRK